MMWLTWRQFRWQAIVASSALAAVAIVLAATGPHLAALYDNAGLASCRAGCGSLASTYINQLKGSLSTALFYASIAAMYLAPALMGIFWGAPLIAREIEAGTLRLAWNQSITRTRWTIVKLGLVGLAAMATAGLLSLIIGWWASPIDLALSYGTQNSPIGFNRLSPVMFAARGVAPLGYAAFAFALGVTLGVALRRTLPAMAITVVLFAACQVLVPVFVRPNIISPVRVTAPLDVATASITIQSAQGASTGNIAVTGNFGPPGAWILSDQAITRSGRVLTVVPKQCLGGGSFQPCNNWLDSLRLRQLVTYQPASRFWPLQWLEAAIYLAAAGFLGWICIWLIHRRRS